MQCCPQIIDMVKVYGIDYFDSALLSLDNFVSRGTEQFLQNPDYLTSLNGMIEHVLADEGLDEDDVRPAPKLMEVVLQNCRGRVDGCVAPYLTLALRRMDASGSAYMQDLCMNVVASAFFYSPQLALATLAAQGASPAIFSTWFSMISARRRSGGRKHFRREYDKKVQVLGLMTVLALPDASLPPELAAGLDRLLGAMTALLAALKDQQEQEKEDEDTEEDDDDEDVGTSGAEESPAPSPGGIGDDEDDTDEEVNEQYLARMARATRRLARHHEESEDDDEDDWTEDEDVHTPLDPIDPFIAFADTLGSLRQHLPARFEMLTARQDAETRAVWQDLLQHADAQRAAKAAQATG